MTTPRVLFVGNFLSQASNPHYCEELATRLEGRAWSIVRTSSHVSRVRRLVDMLRVIRATRNDYDIAHVDVFSGRAFVWAELACFELRRLGKPYMLTLRGGLLGEFAKRWPRRVAHLLCSAAIVSAPSDYLRAELAALRPDIFILPNGIDARSYDFVERTAVVPRLVWVRAYHETYNPLLAIEALAELSKQHPQATLHMLGADKQDGSLTAVERRARELGVFQRVALLGRVPKNDISTYLDPSDVFINTTNADNTPVSVLEAMAAGLCVVSTDVGGIPFLLSHEKNALLVPPRDPHAMADAVGRLVTTPALAQQLSRGGREVALRCDWQPVLDRWEHTLRELGAHA